MSDGMVNFIRKTFLFQAANVLIGLLLVIGFMIGISRILQTIRPARFYSMGALKPQPMDYLWQIDIQHAPIDKNLIRYYADYYENLLQVFPQLADAYGVLGYCFHYLGNDLKAKEFFKKAIDGDPSYFWYYYDLAILYIHEHHYPASLELLGHAIQINPQTNIKALVTSPALFPLWPSGSPLNDFLSHFGEGYNRSLFLIKILDPALPKAKAEGILKQLKLELYLF
jgi:tetratricopeptide (TPR) repeat protein